MSLDDTQRALKDIEVMLQSLHRVGSFYADDQQRCDEETIRVIDDLEYAKRLARVRGFLMRAVRRDLTAIDIAKLEETLSRVRHWRPPTVGKHDK